MNPYAKKSLIIFDLDGTLAESKQPMDAEMAELLDKLLEKKHIAIISGGSFAQFEKQFLPAVEHTPNAFQNFSNLYLLPASGSAMYDWKKKKWIKEYSHDLSTAEKQKIRDAFEIALAKVGEKTPEKLYGEQLEDRGSQMTFSALGQAAPITVKATWDPTEKRRLAIAAQLQKLLPEFSIGIGGMTSIDVTKSGIDKAFGVAELSRQTAIPIDQMLYVGDALFPGGNDYAARKSGVECFEVAHTGDTKKLIQKIIG
ncbi:MAG: HAD-IIB family hydrolase [Patescibacteria group bacterium]|nr:HAD-IIB family hydrolase [Patescibacteria group bacterium]